MNLNDALAKATANGWTDDSQWTRSTVAAQVSTERDGFIASVVVNINGIIRWGVSSTNGTARYQRGVAATIDDAVAACENSMVASLGTLF